MSLIDVNISERKAGQSRQKSMKSGKSRQRTAKCTLKHLIFLGSQPTGTGVH